MAAITHCSSGFPLSPQIMYVILHAPDEWQWTARSKTDGAAAHARPTTQPP